MRLCVIWRVCFVLCRSTGTRNMPLSRCFRDPASCGNLLSLIEEASLAGSSALSSHLIKRNEEAHLDSFDRTCQTRFAKEGNHLSLLRIRDDNRLDHPRSTYINLLAGGISPIVLCQPLAPDSGNHS
ncbi:hypothetical protein BKA70DRAFT_646774 [Coprinopsis sp. MPI-PUGE-AT-0042]|nr:hypothetical protein BKA70DRAFT_646774 [Coprinopsis sp. MPI-PUGE-AT-0042]